MDAGSRRRDPKPRPFWGLCDAFEKTEWPPALYVRAARRLHGDETFTQNTPDEQRAAGGDIGEKSVGVGCYNFDSHTAQRIACVGTDACYGAGPPNVSADAKYAWMEGDVEVSPGRYQIPFSVMLPRRNETSNLLVASTPSATHIGMSTLRMEPQFMILGHAAGTAAALAIKASGGDVRRVDLSALHAALLAEGQTLRC